MNTHTVNLNFNLHSLSCIDCVIIDPELYKIMNIISGCVSEGSVVKINDPSNRTDWSRRTKWHLVCIIGSRASCHWHSHSVKCYLTCSHLVTALIRPGDVSQSHVLAHLQKYIFKMSPVWLGMGNIFRSETNYLQLIKLKQRMLGEMRVAAILALKILKKCSNIF